jgi:hypothetical protein
MTGINDFIKAFTILGSLISIKALIESQQPDDKKEHILILRRIEASLKSKGIID